jgi:hypothetical protein
MMTHRRALSTVVVALAVAVVMISGGTARSTCPTTCR